MQCKWACDHNGCVGGHHRMDRVYEFVKYVDQSENE